MTAAVNRQIRLAARPHGFPKESDFRQVEVDVPRPRPGQMLCRTIYLSLDPYMRGRMNAKPSYAPAVAIDDVMVGQTVSRVEHSRIDGFQKGDYVLTWNGWQDYALSDGSGVRKLDPALAPVSTALGVLGMPGLTAYVGMLDIGQPETGETVVVSAASGAVGSVAGQIASRRGCHVVGIVSNPDKCLHTVAELGFDACVMHTDPGFALDLESTCPDGIDVYFDNVGGDVFDTVVPLLNRSARVPVCGRIANYNQSEPPAGPDRVPQLLGQVLVKRITLQGFIVFDHADREAAFQREVGAWIRDGSLKYREDVVEGLDNAVSAFQGLMQGHNFGKLLVRVSPDPSL